MIDNRLLREWDYEKNTILPKDITPKSAKKIWWKCKFNHSWEARMYTRTDGSNCPYCNNQKVFPGFNDFATIFPELLKEWDYSKNTIKPSEVTSKSSKKIWWKCSKGHSYYTSIHNRTGTDKSGCPYCVNKKVLKGYNDLLSNKPEFFTKNIFYGWWDYEKNTINPEEVAVLSSKKAWWKCIRGHSWQATIYSRVNSNGCPKCISNQTSFGEQCIYYYLLPYNAKNRFKLDNMEVDIYLPNSSDEIKPIGIEFNGIYWHRNKKEKDLIKELKLSSKMNMYYICESNKNEIKGNRIFFNKEKYNLNLEWAIKTLFNILNLDIDVNIERDKQLIYKRFLIYSYHKTLRFTNPEVLIAWDYEKNQIKPDQVKNNSAIKVWWKCKFNHSWEQQIKTKVKNLDFCPICEKEKKNEKNNLSSMR